MFIPSQILYEKDIEKYPLGKELLEKYADIPKTIIENHNNNYPSLLKKMKDHTKAYYSQGSIVNQYNNMFNTFVAK